MVTINRLSEILFISECFTVSLGQALYRTVKKMLSIKRIMPISLNKVLLVKLFTGWKNKNIANDLQQIGGRSEFHV